MTNQLKASLNSGSSRSFNGILVQPDADAGRIGNRQEAFGIQLHEIAQFGEGFSSILGELLNQKGSGSRRMIWVMASVPRGEHTPWGATGML